MNLYALQNLAEWLDAGAPHAQFDMMAGLRLIDYDPEAKTACGTLCCIGGAAYQMSVSRTGLLPTAEELIRSTPDTIGRTGFFNDAFDWHDISLSALRFLGLEPDYDACTDAFFVHPLFDPSLAPENCTPQEAAQAVRNVMDGRNPWD